VDVTLDPVTRECLRQALTGDLASEMALLDRLVEAGQEGAVKAWRYLRDWQGTPWPQIDWDGKPKGPSWHRERSNLHWGWFGRSETAARDNDDLPVEFWDIRGGEWKWFETELEAWEWALCNWTV